MSDERSKFFNYFGPEALLGGLNVTDNPLIVGPAEMTEANNILVSQSLARRKRPGKEAYITATYAEFSEAIRGVIQYWRFLSNSGTSVEDIFLHNDAKVYQVENRLTAPVDRSAAFTFDTAAVPSYQVFEGILYFASTAPGNDGYKKWNGRADVPGNVEAATAPADGAMKFLSVFKARMMAAGNVDFPFRLYVSEALDAEAWTGGSSTSFDIDYDGDPDGITALFGEYQGRFYFATSSSVYELYWPDPSDVATAQISRLSDGIGCIGPRMFIQTPNDILFWSYRGLHSLKKTITSDQTEFNFLSKPIQKLVTEQLNEVNLFRGQAVWDKGNNLMLTTVPSAGQQENDIVLAYNVNFNLWTTWSGIDARSLNKVLISRKEYVLCGGEDGQLSFLNPRLSDDFGDGFAANFKTAKLFPGGDIMSEKHFMSVILLASSTKVSDITVEWSIDGRDGTKSGSEVISLANAQSLLGSTFVLGQSKLGIGRFLPVRFTVDDYGYNIQLNISCSGDSDIEFYGYILEVEDANATYK